MIAPSPLELLHPAGRVDRLLALGDHCPPALVPRAATMATEYADLALIAPSPAELRQSGWLERATVEAARGLAPHGFAYALPPRRGRAAASRRLGQAGLVLETPFAHFPGGGVPRYLLPLQAAPWRHGLNHQIGARPRARRGLLAARALPLGARSSRARCQRSESWRGQPAPNRSRPGWRASAARLGRPRPPSSRPAGADPRARASCTASHPERPSHGASRSCAGERGGGTRARRARRRRPRSGARVPRVLARGLV